MSTFGKICIAICGTLVFLLVTLSILVKVVVTPEKVRENLLPLAEEVLQRKIDVGEIDIGIFSGVSLTDLRVQKRKSPADFITVKYLGLHYKLLAMLTGDLVVDQIFLEEPRIEIVRDEKGEFNFSDLLTKKEISAGSQSRAEATSDSSAFDLLVNEVSITGGELLFVDHLQSVKSPYRYSFDQFNFHASQITLDKAFPLETSAKLNGSKIVLSGHYDIAAQRGDLDLQLSSVDLVKFAPYYRNALPGKLGSALLSLNLEVQLQREQLESKGTVLVEQLDLVLSDLPEAAFQGAKLGLDYAVNYDNKAQKLDVSTLLINLNDSVVGVEGTVDLAGSEPTMVLSLLFDQLDLRNLFSGLPSGLTKKYQGYDLAGKIDGKVELIGSATSGSKLLHAAKFSLLDVRASVDKQRTAIDGKITYADQQVQTEHMVLSVADQQVNIEFKATDLQSELIGGEFKITAKELDLNRLLPQKKTAEGQDDVVVQRQPTFADEIGPFDLPLDMTGSLRVGKLLYRQLDLDQVTATLEIKDNHLKIKQLRSGMAGGEFIANADIDLGVKGLAYQGQMKLDQSKLLTLVSGLLPQTEQSVSGMLQWQNNFAGRGTIPDNLLQSLQVSGLMHLHKGQIAGSPLMEQLAAFLGVPDLKLLSFEDFESRYDLRNGTANLTGQLNSSKAKFKPAGTIGVDGALNLKLDTRLAPELMRKLDSKNKLQNILSDKEGWGVLPLVVKGTLSSPKVTFDAAGLQQQATEKVKEEATKRLLDEIMPDGEKDQAPVKELLKGTLDRLFGN